MMGGTDDCGFSRPLRPGLRYGRVYFALRDRFGLSTPECLLIDVIDTLSRRTGRCYASRRYLAATIGVSIRSLRRSVGRLETHGLLERDRRSQHLWPSTRWRQARQALGDDGLGGSARPD